MRIGTGFLFVICITLPACRFAAPAPKGPARETVVKYLDALVKQDWDSAYAQLHPDTCKKMDRANFERRGLAYCKSLGFALGAYAVRTCDEQGTKAVAQIMLTDAGKSAKHHYREGLVLQSTSDGWAIVLPANFGKR